MHHNTSSSASHLTSRDCSPSSGRGRPRSPGVLEEAFHAPDRGTYHLQVDSGVTRVPVAQFANSVSKGRSMADSASPPDATVAEWKAYSNALADNLRAEVRRAVTYHASYTALDNLMLRDRGRSDPPPHPCNTLCLLPLPNRVLSNIWTIPYRNHQVHPFLNFL